MKTSAGNGTGKKHLLLAAFLFVIVGVSSISLLFAKSLSPSRKVLAERPFFDIEELSDGSYRFENLSDYTSLRLLIIHDLDSALYTYIFPENDGKIPMPDNYWDSYTGYHHCTDFRPQLDENNRLKKDGVVKCFDQSLPDWGEDLWAWRYNGERSNRGAGWLPDLMAVELEIIGSKIYINR